MQFAFTEDQLLFRDAVRDLLTRECPPDRVRTAWERDDGRLPDLWSALGEMGVLGLQVPEAEGGMGLGELDLVLLIEETGHVALPEPIIESAAVAAPLLGDLLLDEVPERDAVEGWLIGLAGGELIVTTGFGGPFVPNADSAGVVLVERDGRLLAVPTTATTLVAQSSVDGSRRLFDVSWADDDPSVVVLADGATAANLIERARARGAVATAAQLVGLSQAMLDLTVEYVKERRQFGVPIGSFQAVKHHLADAALKLEFARPVVHAAAYALALADPAEPLSPRTARAVAHAKAAAGDAAEVVGRQALQCHGAIGYTVEYDLHLFLKRAWALSATYGDAAQHRRQVADLVLGPLPS